ncbi:MAG TPA: M67 family metallopeptidase [Croceibacterium sp.]|nr:M67 family metallopeptidase [Croceibacterium sp.]
MKLVVTRAALATMLSEARISAPEECCGILLGRDDRIEVAAPARNVHLTPKTHFEIEPQALVNAHRAARAGGPAVIGYYHSHPGGAAAPSATDRAEAAHDGAVWAIMGEGGVTFWRDDERGFVPLSSEVEEG